MHFHVGRSLDAARANARATGPSLQQTMIAGASSPTAARHDPLETGMVFLDMKWFTTEHVCHPALFLPASQVNIYSRT
jgi:hypothetical protein